MHSIALFVHILAATVWTGGHLVLAIAVLPTVLKTRDLEYLRRFEDGYEKIGIPFLLLLVATGLYMAAQRLPVWSMWFEFDQPVSRLVGYKIILLGVTIALAVDARLRIIPRLTDDNLAALALHIVPVTVVSVLFVFVGVSFRTGWLW